MRLLGHPLHPMLVHFPIAFWTVATLCEIAALVGTTQFVALASAATIVGLVTGAAAMAFGLPEFMRLKSVAERRIAERHIYCAGGAWTAYLINLLLKLDATAGAAPGDALASASSILGFVLLGFAGWYGGRLVYGHGVGTAHHRDHSA